MSYALPFLSFSEVSNIKICLLKLRSQQHYECTVILSNADTVAFSLPCKCFTLFVWLMGQSTIMHKQRERKLLLSISMTYSLIGLFIMI